MIMLACYKYDEASKLSELINSKNEKAIIWVLEKTY